MKHSYAVFGLGTFGTEVAVELSTAGNTVVAVDMRPEAVEAIKDKVTEAIVANISSPEVISQLDVKKFDAIIIGLTSHFEDTILALTLARQEGAGKIIVKANSEMQRRILLRLGADEVIHPDLEVAERLSKRLSLNNVLDMIEFKGSCIAEVKLPESMDGRTIRELALRNAYNIIVMLIKKPGRAIETVWDPDMVLNTGDQLTVFGSEKVILDVFKS